MIRSVKILLVALVALWGVLGAIGNVMNLQGAYVLVLQTLAMPGFEADAAPPWANQSAVLGVLGVALIVFGKLAPAVLCSVGAAHMAAARRDSEADWQSSKSYGIAGCAIAVATLFLGWTVVGEFMFMIFLDPGLANAANAAFRYGGFIALIMLFVAQRE